MTKGFLIHAYNNKELDYGTMALCSALLIKKNLHVNATALVTSIDTFDWLSKTYDKNLIDSAFDKIIVTTVDRNVGQRTFFDTRYSSKKQPYFNTNRCDSYNITPWDQTILLDADYLMLDSSFDFVWNSVEDIMVNKIVKDLADDTVSNIVDSRVNEIGIPLYWATAVYFQKSPRTQAIFELVQFIKENYQFYQYLYRLPPSNYFRNDYAFSIALHLISGGFENDSIKSFPNPIIQIATENDDFINFKNGSAYFISEKEQGQHRLHKVMTNIHVMNKWSYTRMAKRIISYATS